MKKTFKIFNSKWILLLLILLGIILRMLVAARGYNYDLNSYILVAKIVDSGKNVYVSTYRYNYAPLWSQIVYLLYLLVSRNEYYFRYVIALFLSFIDMGIFIVLWQRLGKLVACLFLFNPISIIITGYHNQFDNLALLLGMSSVILIGDDFEKTIKGRKLIGVLLLALSLIIKHVLFLFPFWLAVKQKGFFQKCLMAFIPVILFLLSFIPYWAEGKADIIKHVFTYPSQDNGVFYKYVIPMFIQNVLNKWFVWVILLVVFAFFFRRSNPTESLLVYSSILVWASPAVANQYLAIPIAFISANINPFTIVYTVIGALFLLVNGAGLQFTIYKPLDIILNTYSYKVLIFLLLFGFIWKVWHESLKGVFKKVINEIMVQVGFEEG